MGDVTNVSKLTVDDGQITIGATTILEAEFGYLDGQTAGTVTASKAVVVDANKDIGDFRNVDATNFDAGLSGTAGSVDIFPASATSGKLALTAADSAGDTTTTIVNASQSGARTYTIPDAGASANFVMSSGTQTVLGPLSLDDAAASGADTAALVLGGGTSGDPITTATANKNFLGFWTESTATTGDSRGLYVRHYVNGAGSGEALRAYGTISYAGAAGVGGTINGAHISLSVNSGASVSGQAHALRVTLDYATATRTTDANVAALDLDSNIGANNTVHANVAFMRLTNSGAVNIEKFLRTPNAASAGLLATHTTDAMTHSLRCVSDDGTVFYIMATTTSSNRTGGA